MKIFKNMTSKTKKDLGMAAAMVGLLGCGMLMGNAIGQNSETAQFYKADITQNRPARVFDEDATDENAAERDQENFQKGYHFKGHENAQKDMTAAVQDAYNQLSDADKKVVQEAFGKSEEELLKMETTDIADALKNMDETTRDQVMDLFKENMKGFAGRGMKGGNPPEAGTEDQTRAKKGSGKSLSNFAEHAEEVYQKMSDEQKKQLETLLGLDAAAMKDQEKVKTALEALDDAKKQELKDLVKPVMKELGLNSASRKQADSQKQEGTSGENTDQVKPVRPEKNAENGNAGEGTGDKGGQNTPSENREKPAANDTDTRSGATEQTDKTSA